MERHIETIRTALSEAGYEVRVFGKRPKSIPIGRIERIIDMLGTFAAGWGYAALREELGLFAPDAVWLHSCTKTYGLDSVKMLAGYRGRRIFTYHDFSLFSPFASRMRSLSDVPDTWTLSAYLATLGRTHIIERFYLRLKFRKISSIQHELARFDRHVVPSEFMTDFVRRFIGVPESRIQTLPHFLPERPE
ncbi:MAG TPA: glycosyltransferase family 4 protein [bacterium]|nr:glycosyltransferase family 4 protein [bacterium]